MFKMFRTAFLLNLIMMDEFEFKLETFKDIDLGESFASAKESLKNFKKKIDELKGFNKDDLYTYEYCKDLRNNIDIDREVVKLKLDTHYLKLIEEVNAIEIKCKEKSASTNKLIDEKVKQLDEKFQSFRSEMDQLKLDFKRWENIQKESNIEVNKVNVLIERFKNELLLGQSFVLETKAALFDVAIKASKIRDKKSMKKGILKK